jgi:transcription-repair coupling factor (superfamily II helicase)
MHLDGLTALLHGATAFRACIDRLQAEKPATLNLVHAARPYLLATLARTWDGPILYVTGRIKRAYNVAEQLPVWLGDDRPVFRFNEPVPQFYERAPWGEEALQGRMATLAALMTEDAEEPPLVVTSARALMQRTMPVGQFRQNSLSLRVDQRHAIGKLLAQFVTLGYEQAPIVVQPGTFSRRGGVIDVFPVAALQPLRIDFFDDTIDSLRWFDPASQRSKDHTQTATVTPAREALASLTPRIAPLLAPWFESLPAAEDDMTAPGGDAQPIQNGQTFPHLEYYLPYLYPNPVSLLDYAPAGSLIVVEDWDYLQSIVEEITEQAEARRTAEALPPDYPTPYIGWDLLADDLHRLPLLHLTNGAMPDADETVTEFDGLFQPGGRYGGQLRAMLTDLRALRNDGDRVIVITEQAERIKQLWYEQDSTNHIPTMQTIQTPPDAGSVIFVNGILGEGWKFQLVAGSRLHLLSDAEIFGWSRPEPRRRKTINRRRTPESDYADWQIDDYVVHTDYGIGQFGGLTNRTIDGNEREYLLIQYAGSDMIFVPIHQADRLTRYIGADEVPPKLSRLGKADWERVKARTKKAVEDEAKDLLELYAARAKANGHAYSPDTHWQHELEASFPYVETEDQLRSVQEVKVDMELSQPMDRLICGDVGYGKTEVAIRAAFKAINDGRQVAVLVPTTVLAQQHYETFSNRLAPFPVKLESLSRFRSKHQQSRILPKIASGEIDIVIGTHRILSKDVTFRDLGLVIIDEEQRFGVKHKEHFKKLRQQIDVLTLTATPIPRTLYMSLTGVRDISMIQTPPEERLPVITHVGRFDDHLVRQAILREMERGGQVFIVHNRVRTIETLGERIEAIVPEARTIIGHGQMHERELERVMTAFAHHEYDILISTTIIESGIDIPNANTLIIDRADHMGLAQLYQLRGRVGRSAQQGFAYFFHPRKMTEEARSRLETLAENTHLGAGFDIAMRDLELRGAGDILSTRQTGHVSAVGLHLYTQLLSQAIKRLKGDAPPAENETPDEPKGIVIDLPLPAYLPTDWIPEIALRLQIYRRIAGLGTREDIAAMRAELTDRFGQLPHAVENLLYQIEIKLIAQQAGATHIMARKDQIQIKLPYLGEINRPALEQALGDDVSVSRVAVTFPGDDEAMWKPRLLNVLMMLRPQHEPTEELEHGI